MIEKIIVGAASAIVSAVLTYGAAGLRLEGRIDGVEKALQRIEAKLTK